MTFRYTGTVYSKEVLEGFYDSCSAQGDSNMTLTECCASGVLDIETTLTKGSVDVIVGVVSAEI